MVQVVLNPQPRRGRLGRDNHGPPLRGELPQQALLPSFAGKEIDFFRNFLSGRVPNAPADWATRVLLIDMGYFLCTFGSPRLRLSRAGELAVETLRLRGVHLLSIEGTGAMYKDRSVNCIAQIATPSSSTDHPRGGALWEVPLEWVS